MVTKIIRRHYQRNLVSVPSDLAEVTCVDPAEQGQARLRESIWRRVEDLYRTGYHPGISLCVRHRGRVVLNRAIGHARGNAPGDSGPAVPLDLDTPISLFSSSKAMTALLIHQLAEQGYLSLHDPVAETIPEFGRAGKHKTTVEQVLAHQAGIPSFPTEFGIEHAGDWDAVIDVLCRMPPMAKAGRMTAYHAITGGFILGEVAQRATGRPLPELLDTLLRKPLGLKHFTYGVDPAHNDSVALNAFTGPPLPPILGAMARKALGIEFEEACAISNTPIFLNNVIPAGNIFSTAEESSRVFQMLLDGGRWEGQQLLKPETVRQLAAPFGRIRYDRMLRIPIRYSRGLMLGHPLLSLYGHRNPLAFGHLGFLNILCWADPERDISVALLTTGKAAIGPHLPALARVLGAINSGFAPQPVKDQPDWTVGLPRGLAAMV